MQGSVMSPLVVLATLVLVCVHAAQVPMQKCSKGRVRLPVMQVSVAGVLEGPCARAAPHGSLCTLCAVVDPCYTPRGSGSFRGFAFRRSAVGSELTASSTQHTVYQNFQKANACAYNSDGTNLVTGRMAPGHLFIAAPNDYTGDGFGFQNSQACGVCYQVTGISGRPVTLMVTDVSLV